MHRTENGRAEFEESVALLGYGTGFRPDEGSLIGFSVPGGRQAVEVTSNLRVGNGASDSDFLTPWGLQIELVSSNHSDTQ